MPAFGMSFAGLCASSAASGSSSMPRKNHIANGSANEDRRRRRTAGTSVLPSVGAMFHRLEKSTALAPNAMITNTARIASEMNEMISANRNEIAAPAELSAMKTM